MSVNEKVLDAIELLTKNSVQRAKYDRTIQAQIISCEDQTIGEYKCRYQDATIRAYSNNIDVKYASGKQVYILIPGNDMSQRKTILGAVDKLGLNYISAAIGDQAYNIIKNNCIISEDIFTLNINNTLWLYNKDNKNENNLITVNQRQLNEYLKQSPSMIIEASFQTFFDKSHQAKGNYGIIYNLCFLDNATKEEVIRSYVIDINDMTGNPYNLTKKTRQYKIFDIDNENFVRLDSIQLFSENFIQENQDSNYIQVSNFQINSASRITQEELDGVAISFYTPQGTIFSDAEGDNYKTLTAQIKLKGKLVTSTQNIGFYWGIQNIRVRAGEKGYNQYLGNGWECLNSHINDEYVPSSDTYIINKSELTAKNNRIKVAVIYDGNVFTKTINIQLLNSKYNVFIESDSGTQFYYDIGYPTLTCLYTAPAEEQFDDIFYYWTYESNLGYIYPLNEDNQKNDKYNDLIEVITNIEKRIKNDEATLEDIRILNSKRIQLASFDTIELVQKNKVIHTPIRDIIKFKTFRCSVFGILKNTNKEIYLGTGQIVLTNSLDTQGEYSLIINNGNIVYQYNEEGQAPNSAVSARQQPIKTLTFTVFDNLGNPIDDQVIAKNAEWVWQLPNQNTMLMKDNNHTQEEQSNIIDLEEEKPEYLYFHDLPNFNYGILSRYNVNNQNNQIKLTLKYHDKVLTASTSFTFVKQGQPGTNGTEYFTRIVPGSSAVWIDRKDKEEEEDKKLYFSVEIWKDGDLFWSSLHNDDNIIIKNIKWEILKYEGYMDKTDEEGNTSRVKASSDSYFTIDESSGVLSKNQQEPPIVINKNLSDIIKCSVTIEDKIYFATLPITVVELYQSQSGYSIELKENTGFKYVLYSNAGNQPKYDTTFPFEIICKQNQEDISTVWIDENQTIRLEYDFEVTNNLLEKLPLKEEQRNLFRCRPVSNYDGRRTDAAVICTINRVQKENNEIASIAIGKIHIPIHFLLNRYNFAYLNDWDGNSIKIKDNDDSNNYILAPQMGAGRKDSENGFTGVLMGAVATSTKQDIGLLGYANGQRTFFLNSENGSAIFGKANAGQIIIDPRNDHALLYSHDFWDNYDDKGLPQSISYEDDGITIRKPTKQKNGKLAPGMLIDLTTPEIYWRNKNFSVDKDGNITAIAGQIGGWTLSDNSLSSSSTKKAKIYTGDHSILTSSANGFYLSHDGISIGSKFKVTNDGVVRVGNNAVSNDSSDCWEINGDGNGSFIRYGKWDKRDPKAKVGTVANYVKIGTDKIALGCRYDGDDKNENPTFSSMFSVDKQGNLMAKKGSIGGWQITNTAIFYGSDVGASNSENIVLDAGQGQLRGGNGNWYINANGTAGFKNIEKLSGSSGGYGFSFPGATFNAGGSNAFGGPSSFTANMNVNASANFWGSVRLPGTVSLGGTWDLSKSNIRKLIIDEIQAHKVTADEIWFLYRGLSTNLAGAMNRIAKEIDDVSATAAQAAVTANQALSAASSSKP